MGTRTGLGWRFVLPVVTALAGLMFAGSAVTARGGDLRSSSTQGLVGLVRERERVLAGEDAALAQARAALETATRERLAADPTLAALDGAARAVAPAAAVEPIRGRALEVSLSDAPTRGPLPDGVGVDDVVVHQQDVQAVVNALLAAGARGITVQGQRLTSTSAVRCVGNTLILHGRVSSPPYVVVAVGDPAAMRRSLDADPAVTAYRDDAARLGLGFDVRDAGDLVLPAYTGPLDRRYAQVVR